MAKKKSTVPKAPVAWNSLELAARVAPRVELVDVRLLACGARQSDGSGGKLVASNRVEVDVLTDPDRGLILVKPGFHFQAVHDGGSDEEPALSIDCTFILAYTASELETLSEAEVRAFAEINGVFNAWPYWREFVQNTAARMGLPRLVVPVFRFQDR